ncbi:monothiol glutaredoxin-5 [Macrolepiota fuliginosa MF-IS2]|uniref:Monothiol glutaredoxin-5, mitochondrial n=1 Tax=Macrolepiota fuliginosa MF-IS2 TaxID=1400762 RepID=A0A9P5XDY3_9AGAR|nr:monothiol glutaredoxin-5 [Macrolepiota fuliginosa MF-IS2]
MFRPVLRSSTRLLRGTTPASFLSGRLAAYRFLSQEARSQIQKAVTSTPVVLFMKGTPDEPQCGFSRAAIQVLELQGVPQEKLKTFNVLADQELRSGIKEFSEWPTIPQIYVNGEFIGGCDILISMHQSGELETLLENNGVIPKVEETPAQSNSAAPAS